MFGFKVVNCFVNWNNSFNDASQKTEKALTLNESIVDLHWQYLNLPKLSEELDPLIGMIRSFDPISIKSPLKEYENVKDLIQNSQKVYMALFAKSNVTYKPNIELSTFSLPWGTHTVFLMNHHVLSDEEVKEALQEQRKRNNSFTDTLKTPCKRNPIEITALDTTRKLAADGVWKSGANYFQYKESKAVLDEHYSVDICEVLGSNIEMEDTHLATTITVRGKTYPLLAVFDGHDGDNVAKYLKEKLPSKLTKKLIEYSCGAKELSERCIYNALRLSLVDLDDEYLVNIGGSTAIVSLIVNGKIYTASVGDSRAIIIRPYSLKFSLLSTDAVIHKRGHPDSKHRNILEKKRANITYDIVSKIYRAGGVGMGSAVGDHENLLNCTVEISDICISSSEDTYLLLASDGLWDELSPFDATFGLQSILSNPNYGHENLATLLSNACFLKAKGCTDNITALLCKIPKVET